MENTLIPDSFDYDRVAALSAKLCKKFKKDQAKNFRAGQQDLRR
jgi:tRNA U34 5-carboxymethylaminomethyl modifying enzyme MnmG/GidA